MQNEMLNIRQYCNDKIHRAEHRIYQEFEAKQNKVLEERYEELKRYIVTKIDEFLAEHDYDYLSSMSAEDIYDESLAPERL